MFVQAPPRPFSRRWDAMLTRSMAAGLLVLGWSAATAAEKDRQGPCMGMPVAAASVEKLQREAIRAYGACDASTHRAEGKEAVVILAYSGSGVIRTSVFCYVREDGVYHLMLCRKTTASKVSISVKEKELVATSKSGRRLFSLPFDSMVWKLEP